MAATAGADQVASALRTSIGRLVRRLRRITKVEGGLSLPEASALARLESGGPTTTTALAKLEQISPQSIGATLTALEARGLLERRPDPQDGRRVFLSITDQGLSVLRDTRDARTAWLAQALSSSFTRSELEQLLAVAPLLERLAEQP